MDQPLLVGEGEKVRWLGDRIAIVIAESEEIAQEARQMVRVEYEKLASDVLLESSEQIRVRVEVARGRQRQRFEGTRLSCNAEMGPGEVREYCRPGDGERSLLRSAMHQLQMSARAFHRILRLARTIADLDGEGEINTAHLAEAIQYRPRRQM